MTEARHTPGPWRADRAGFHGDQEWFVEAPDTPDLRIVADEIENEADALLIAAAPALADAAMDAWRALMWIAAYDSEDKILQKAIDKLEAAVSKAGTYDFVGLLEKVEASRVALNHGQRE